MNKVHLTKTRPPSNIDISKHPVLLFPRSDYQNFEDGNETAFLEEEIHLKIDEVKEDKLDKEFEEDEKNDNKKESLKAKHVCDICGLGGHAPQKCGSRKNAVSKVRYIKLVGSL